MIQLELAKEKRKRKVVSRFDAIKKKHHGKTVKINDLEHEIIKIEQK